MTKFIKLTGVWAADDPNPVGTFYAAIEHIAGFMRPDFDSALSPEGGEKVTFLLLSGGQGGTEPASSDVFVAETPEQILALIEAANG